MNVHSESELLNDNIKFLCVKMRSFVVTLCTEYTKKKEKIKVFVVNSHSYFLSRKIIQEKDLFSYKCDILRKKIALEQR